MSSFTASRLLKYVNILIAALLAAALALVWWYGYRPLAQTSGTAAIPAAAPVSVRFDGLGEPHIRAASQEDALVAQGYVTAQDRLWQMEGLRRAAAGDLAEIIGPTALDSDRESRRMRMRRIAEQAYTTLPAEDRAAFAAYARGVNAYIATHLGRLPLEFKLLGYEPRPWSTVDSILVCLYMFRYLTNTWRYDLVKGQMLAEGNAEKVNLLYPVRTGNDVQPGSNGWVIAGSRTASGKPLLSNDMHLQFSLPSIWYMAHLEAPGLDVAGVTLPGTPGVMVGHNRRIAWGITNLQFDVEDLYIEPQFDERTGRYLYRGQVEQARRETELIRVKGRPTEQLTVWVTRHGPIFAADGDRRMALRWVAAERGMIRFPIMAINRAENWQQFTAALAAWPGPGSNFVYADVDGHIGYHAAGALPIRRGWTGDVPVDGSAGDREWDGFIPFDRLPAIFDPPAGIIVTANQNPFPPEFAYTLNGAFAPYYRAGQIRNLLLARRSWRAEEMLEVQKDIYSAFDKFLAQEATAAYDRRGGHNPSLDPAVALLRKWNGQMDQELGAPFLAELLSGHVRTAMAESASPGKGAAYTFPMSTVAIEGLLRARPAGWFGGDYDGMLLRALADAVEEGGRIQGRDAARWRYGRYLRVGIANPVMHQVPLIGRYFDIGPVEMGGSGTTVKQTGRTLGPSMRMTADLANWDASILNLVTGQSGQILSSHYRDQWKAYYDARSYPMQFGRVEVKSTLELTPAP